MKPKSVYKWRRYRNVPRRSISTAMVASACFSAWYWARTMDEPGILFALAVAATMWAGILIGLELALLLVPGWRSSRGGS